MSQSVTVAEVFAANSLQLESFQVLQQRILDHFGRDVGETACKMLNNLICAAYISGSMKGLEYSQRAISDLRAKI